MLRLSAENVELDRASDSEGLSGSFVCLHVADTGTGMEPEVLARVFEPFFSTKEVGRGTGLGLAQVYGFARQSGGGVRVASRRGEGTTVTLLLPRSATLPNANVQPAGTESETVPAEAHAPRKVLLVEDDDDLAALTAEMLRHLGHEVSRVASGPAALKALAEGLAADLVMTDVIMPGGQDGLDVARRLVDENPDMPVLLCSGYGGVPARVAAAGLPLLRKPFSLAQLRRAIVAACDASLRTRGRPAPEFAPQVQSAPRAPTPRVRRTPR